MTQAFGAGPVFSLLASALVFFMQAGFAMLCAGSVRTKNVIQIILKNVLDAAFGAIAWYLFGYGFSVGKNEQHGPNRFIGSGWFALSDTGEPAGTFGGTRPPYLGWFGSWTFAATAATIVAGAMAERTTFIGYISYSLLLTGFVYPVVVHWAWTGSGWLANPDMYESVKFAYSFYDLAGSGVVHEVGGLAGLVGAYFVGPRKGRFDSQGKPVTIQGHNTALIALGTLILWFGWYGFNPVSINFSSPAAGDVLGLVATNTTISAACGGVGSLLHTFVEERFWSLQEAANGILAGLVSVTAGPDVMEPWAALICGFGGSLVYRYSAKLLLLLKIDDPLNAAPVHGFCGFYGVIFTGLFANNTFVKYATCTTASLGDCPSAPGGAFYGYGDIFAPNLCGAIVIGLWAMTVPGILFFIMSKLNLLRVSEEDEMAGIDTSHHGGSVYNLEEGPKAKT